MEVQLQELIEQIKKDGVEAAEAEAKNIVDAAREEAKIIVAEAHAQADKILEYAKSENERMTKASEDAIRQAGRNLLITFRESVTRELNSILSRNVETVYSSESLSQLIINIVENWANKPDAENVAIILNSADLKRLEEILLSALKDKMLNGITLKTNDNFDGGFRIAVNNGSAYYDYSSEAVVDMLSNYLTPKVTKLLKEA